MKPPNEPGRSASDAELVHAARRGDKRAFVEIVARHQAMVCGIALAILGDFAASEDAGQEAFLTAWRKIHELREPERLRAWLGQIARNAALGYLRRKRGHDPLESAAALADDSPAPDAATANEEEASLVRESLAKLPETYRVPLILFYREGQSVHAVADTLGISEDAVKQRLTRGREMLRDRISGVIETVLTRTKPSAIFTMTIAAAIGALAAPAAVAATVFTAASAASTSTVAATSTPILTAMSTSKTFLVTTALVAAVCVPIGYRIQTATAPRVDSTSAPQVQAETGQKSEVLFVDSTLFAQWRELHEKYGTNAAAMPAIYKAIADFKDPFRRRAFRAALIAEWVQVDPAGGLAFFVGRASESSQRQQFFEEWLSHDARAAVDALMAGGGNWEKTARASLLEIARRVPSRVPEIVSRLPKAESYWDTSVRDAFTILGEGNLTSARKAAEAITGVNREQALSGIARVWAKGDLDATIAWARKLPEGADRDEIIRAALMGKAAVDPVGALELVGIVPPGGRYAYSRTTTGARVLAEAAKTDYDATVAFISANPGRFNHDDMDGMDAAVTDRINGDPIAFLNKHAADGSLLALMPSISSALLNRGSGQRAAIWEWLKTQPDNDAIKALRDQVLSSASYQDPDLTLRFVNDLPQTPAGDSQIEWVAKRLFNGGHMLYRFDQFFDQVPERLRQPMVKAAFEYLNGDTLGDPQQWIDRLSLLPEGSRAKGTERIAHAFAQQSPEEAIAWAESLASGETRAAVLAGITSGWSAQDAHSAADWVASMPPGSDRDRSASTLVLAVAEKYPREAWDWALSIGDATERNRAATHAAKMMASRDPATARQWIESGPFTPEAKAQLQAALGQTGGSQGTR